MKRSHVLLGLALLLASTAAVFAVSYTWTGESPADSLWVSTDSNPDENNWHRSSGEPLDPTYPGQNSASDDVIIDKSQAPPQFPFLDSAVTINGLVMQDGTVGSKVQLALNKTNNPDEILLEVNGNFTVQEGSVDDGSYIEVIGPDAMKVNGTFTITGGVSDSATLEVSSAGRIQTY